MNSLSPFHLDRWTNATPQKSRRAISTPSSRMSPSSLSTPSPVTEKSRGHYFSSGLKLAALLAAVPAGYFYRQPLGSALYKAWNLLGGFKEIVPLPEPTPQPPPSEKLTGFFSSLYSQGKTVFLSIGSILGLGAVAGAALRKKTRNAEEAARRNVEEDERRNAEEDKRRNEINQNLTFWRNQQTSWQARNAENKTAMLDEIERRIADWENKKREYERDE